MSYLPKNETEPGDPKKPSNARVMIWIVVGGIAIYLIVTGVYGGLTAGS